MRQRNGFTLIELLVVVAIIVALLAILIPSLGPAVGYAETVKCQSNMRNIMLATITYASDHLGALPQPNWLSVEDGGAAEWNGPGWLYNYPNRSLQEHVEAGALWQYLKTYEVYHCPSHAKPWGDGGRTTEALTSYCMNGSVCNFGGKNKAMNRIGDYRSGEDILFWEQDENGLSWNDGSNQPAELITPRHTKAGQLGAGNVAMPDGSCEWISLADFNSEALPAHPAKRTRLWNMPFSDRGW